MWHWALPGAPLALKFPGFVRLYGLPARPVWDKGIRVTGYDNWSYSGLLAPAVKHTE